MDEKENKNLEVSTQVEETQQDTQNNTQNQNIVDTGTNNKEVNSEEAKAEKTFTQTQVSAMMTREKKEGRNSVYNALGIDANDEALIEKVKAFVLQNKNAETENVEKDATAKQDENAFKELEQAQKRAEIAETKVKLIEQGVKPEMVEDVIVLAQAKLNSTDVELTTVISELKNKYPVFFANKEQQDTGSILKQEPKKEESQQGLGYRLAAKKKQANTKNSYWS